jgi:signal transduction histidine kinase
MNFRTRLFLALLVTVLIPLLALVYGIRREMERRLTHEYETRVGAMASVIAADLEQESRGLGARLTALDSALSHDDRFRLAAVRREPASRRYLLDYAGEAMALSGLALLQVQDSVGRILTSGHFRNEFDRLQPELPSLLIAAGTMTLVQTRTPEAPLLALARVDSFKVGGQKFTLVGGLEARRTLLQQLTPGGDLSVSLDLPGQAAEATSGARVVRELRLPYINLLDSSVTTDTARFLVTQSFATLETLRRSVDRWFLVALVLTIGVSLIGAAWLASVISRPLRDLARKTSEIDLDRLDQAFDSDRSDEIGALSRLLGAMTQRIRVSSARLREVERRAAIGDVARQVNHDIKNGLAPIRNVLRHFSQVSQQQPQLLPEVFSERRSTLESSVEYLETLARNYARLSPDVDRHPCDVNLLVKEVLRNTRNDGTEFHARLSETLPPIMAESLSLRRVLENVVGNAADSLADRAGGVVTVSTEPVPLRNPDRVRITVSDTGPGMTREQLERAFNDFYTSKPGGTGLGLSIVRRLVMDLDGSLRIDTEPGAGTRVVVEFPVVGPSPSGTNP